jgi:hypothetical protein
MKGYVTPDVALEIAARHRAEGHETLWSPLSFYIDNVVLEEYEVAPELRVKWRLLRDYETEVEILRSLV